MSIIGRVLTAMVTPFHSDGSVNHEQAVHLADALIASGSDGVVISGTTGEAPTLTKSEKAELFANIKQSMGSRGCVIAGTGTYDTAGSIELSRMAEKTGVDALLLVVPYYNKPPQEGLYRHFEAISSSVNIPCILYNVPSRTGLNMTSDTIVRLSYIDNIIGVKEAGSNFDQVTQVLQGCADGFRVWSGNDDETFQIMTLGGYGVVSVASHLVGNQINNIVNMITSDQLSEARVENKRLNPLFKALFSVSNPIPVKYVLNKIGFNVGNHRLPLVTLDVQTAKKIDVLLESYEIDLPVR